MFERTDSNLDGDIDIVEFVSYCLENEKKLHILFKDIDLNDDGKVDSNELVQAFQRAGIEVDHDEVLRLVHRIKQESGVQGHKSTVELDFEEFRDFLLLHPTDSLSNLMRSWRHGTVNLYFDRNLPSITLLTQNWYFSICSLLIWAKMVSYRSISVKTKFVPECGGDI